MEKEILEILMRLENKIDGLENKIDINTKDIKEIKTKLDGVVDQTANLTEFRTLVTDHIEELKEVEKVTKENCYEIAKIKSAI